MISRYLSPILILNQKSIISESYGGLKMERQNIEQFMGKKVKLILKTNYIYTGIIQKIDNTSLQFLDKKGQRHIFALEHIVEINEVAE